MEVGGETTEIAETGEQLLPDAGKPDAAAATADAGADGGAGQGEPKSVFDAVKAAMDKGRSAEAAKVTATEKPAEEPAAAAEPAGANDAAPADDDDKDRLSDEELSKLSEKARRRFNALYRQARTAETKLERLEPDAKATQQLQQWAKANNVTAEDYTFALEFAAALKNDPAAAHKMIQPALTYMRQHVGEELPADLAAEVNDGTISRERAQELAAARAERQRRIEVDERRAVLTEQEQRAEKARSIAAAASDGIKEYEASWRTSDPDYGKKMKPTWDRMLAIMAQEGQPRSRDEAVTLIKRARKDVEDYFAGLIAPPKEKRGIPPGGSASGLRAQPTSAIEAAKAGLAAMRAA